MKKALFFIIILAFTLKACSQDQTFVKPAHFDAGFYLGGKLWLDMPSGGVADWNTMLNKPSMFPPSTHNHDYLYKPFNYVPDWSEIKNKPTEQELIDALPAMNYYPLTQKTTAQINALVIPVGVVAMVWDKTLGVLKIWDGTKWKIMIANN